MNDARKRDLKGIVQKPIQNFEKTFGKGVLIDWGTLDECFVRIEQTLNNAFPPNDDDPNEFKHAGAMCFWLRRLKPFRYGDDTGKSPISKHVNEILAFRWPTPLFLGTYRL